MKNLYSSPTRRSIMKLFGSTMCRSRKYKFWDDLVEDLLESAWFTLVVYFILFVCFYITIRFNYIHDPSQSIDCHSSSATKNTSQDNLIALSKTVQSILEKIGFQRTTFLCYSTLFELLHHGNLSPTSQRYLIFHFTGSFFSFWMRLKLIFLSIQI